MVEKAAATASPVFIAGCGRSGTTYLKTLVDAHPDVFVPTESLFLVDYLERGSCLPRSLLRALFFAEPQLRAWYSGPPFDAESLPGLIRSVHARAASANDAKVWGQKTPRFVRKMQLFDAAFPGTRWILVYRDPRAVVSSMLRSTRHTYSVRRACRRWCRDNAVVLAAKEAKRRRVLTIAYESLVLEPDEILQQVWTFLDVAPTDLETILGRAQVRGLVGSGFRVNAIRGTVQNDVTKLDAWRSVLTPAQRAYVERKCDMQMNKLGYDATPGPTSPFFVFFDSLHGLRDMGILIQYLRSWPRYLVYTLLRKTTLGIFCALRHVGSSR